MLNLNSCATLFSGLKIGTFAISLFVTASSYAESSTPDSGQPFSHQTVINLAEQLSFTPYQTPDKVPEELAKLSYSDYRAIQFNKEKAIWREDKLPFSIELFAPGYLYNLLVDVDIVEGGKSYPITVSNESFHAKDSATQEALSKLSRYAGFRLHYPLNTKAYADEFVVFQGASYFRAVSKDQLYGLSTRGLAIDVAEQKGEEFPFFKHFWIERPARNAHAIVVHALLDSPSVTGAYRFGIYPNQPTFMDVSMKLFPRKTLKHVGIAPITSMFMHSPMVQPVTPDYRPAVHDSEALALTRGNGEHLWRPLNNPKRLQISAFMDENPLGYGLIQRQRDLSYYQDLEAHYQKRPSVWIKPEGAWGKGHVQLVEIPSDSEGNDNIVAYWRPAEPLEAGKSYSYSYQLSWPDDISPMPTKTRVVRSAMGTKLFKATPEMVIDYSPMTAEEIERAKVNASVSQGKILETHLQPYPEINGARLFVSFAPLEAEQTELRVQLHDGKTPLSETWLYRWTQAGWK